MWTLIYLSFLHLCVVSAGPPNILFILVDDLGWNDVSWHNPQVHMPHIESLARSGLILEQNYVQPTCSPSRTALLTGMYPSRTGYQFMPPNNMEPIGLPTSFKLMPEYLKKLGYSSHIMGKWHLGYCNTSYLPTNRGFDSFVGLWHGGGDHLLHLSPADAHHQATSLGYDFHKDESIYLGAIGTSSSDIIGERINEILSERAGLKKGWLGGYPQGKVLMEGYNASNPLFLYAAFQDVHTPLQAEKEFEDLYPDTLDPSRRTYLGMVSKVDSVVGRIVSDLQRFTYLVEGEERSIFNDTIIIFSSDNGGMSEGLGYGGASNAPLRGRKGDTWEGGCRVPAFVTNTGRVGTTAELVHITDWLPTIYAGFAGGNLSDLPDIDGVNQVGMLREEDGKSQRVELLYDIANFEQTNFTFFVNNGMFPADFQLGGAFGAALRYGSWKLIVGCSTVIGCSRNYNSTWEGNTDNNRILLFNLDSDPEEQVNLAGEGEYVDILSDLQERLEGHLARAVLPVHRPDDPAGHPFNHFPPGQYFSGWCEAILEPETYRHHRSLV